MPRPTVYHQVSAANDVTVVPSAL